MLLERDHNITGKGIMLTFLGNTVQPAQRLKDIGFQGPDVLQAFIFPSSA